MEWKPIESAPKDGTPILVYWHCSNDDEPGAWQYSVMIWQHGEFWCTGDLDNFSSNQYLEPHLWTEIMPPEDL